MRRFAFIGMALLAVTGLHGQDPREAMRAKMEASLAKQRASVQKQVKTAQEAQPGWYTTPWPQAQDWIAPMVPAAADPAPAQAPAEISPPQVSRTAIPMPCDPLAPAELSPVIERTAEREGYSPNLLRAVIRKESAFYPCAVSNKGAMGLMQLMPATAATLGVSDPLDPLQNIDGGARFLGQLLSRYEGDVTKALAAYNAGPGKVDAYGGVPPYTETKNYVREVMGALGVVE